MKMFQKILSGHSEGKKSHRSGRSWCTKEPFYTEFCRHENLAEMRYNTGPDRKG